MPWVLIPVKIHCRPMVISIMCKSDYYTPLHICFNNFHSRLSLIFSMASNPSLHDMVPTVPFTATWTLQLASAMLFVSLSVWFVCLEVQFYNESIYCILTTVYLSVSLSGFWTASGDNCSLLFGHLTSKANTWPETMFSNV